MANLINEAKRMQQLAGILNESQLNEAETRTYDLRDILKNKHVNDNKSNDISVFKAGMDVLPSKYYKSMDEIRTELGKVTKISGNKVFYKTSDIEAGFGFSGNKGEEKSAEPQDLIIATGLTTESQELNEEVIDFKDKDQYADFLQNKTKKLENSKIKLKIYDTFASEDPEKQKYTGDISVNLGKRTGGTGNLTFDATLVDAGEYKYLSSAKGKKISLTIPATTGGQGGFDCEDPKIKGLFKVDSLEILGAPSTPSTPAPQAESLDIEEIVNEALKAVRK